MRAPVGSGFASIDEALGGLITGDNVVWLVDDTAVYRTLADGFAREALRLRQRVLHVDLGAGPWLGKHVEHLDARASTRLARASVLADEVERRVRDDSVDCLVVDDLHLVERRWGADGVLAFFSRVCPTMLQLGVTAYWGVGPAFGRPVVDGIRQITQCLLDGRGGRLRVMKAEGRSDALLGISYHLQVADGVATATASTAGGRLARGLTAVRREFGLTQAELADSAGVTASAISQAESGTRGLSLDTVIAIAEALNISVDRLVNAGPVRDYQLARHDRSRRIANDRVAALASDATVGMRTYLVDLAEHEVVEPPVTHRGVQTVAAIRGLVQVDVGADRPVLRRGDVLVAQHTSIRTWRNLRAEPASVFWVLRD